MNLDHFLDIENAGDVQQNWQKHYKVKWNFSKKTNKCYKNIKLLKTC